MKPAAALLLGLAALLAIGAGLSGRAGAEIWLGASLSVALVAAGLCLWRSAPAFGMLAFGLIAGSAGQLGLTNPFFYPAPRLKPDTGIEALCLALVAAEALIAAVMLWRAGRARILPALRGHRATLAAVAAVGGGLSVSLLGYVPRGAWGELVLHAGSGAALVLIHLATLAAMLTVPAPVARLVLPPPALSAGLALVAAAVLARYGFDRLPHVEDEYAYLFQARSILGGAFAVPAPDPSLLGGLDYYLVTVTDGRWYAVTAPGWPAVLAVGEAIGLGWLVNPLLTALAVWFGAGLVQRFAGREASAMAALLMAVSPWVIAGGASLMTHAVTLALVLWAWLVLTGPRWQAGGAGLAGALAAGLAMGWVFSTRPLDGLIAGGLTGLWLLLLSGGALAGRIGRAAAYAAGCVATGALYLIHNNLMTGHMAVPPLDRYLSRLWGKGSNSFGFGQTVGPPPGDWAGLDPYPGHSLAEAVLNTANNLSALQFELFGWGAGSLALVVLFALRGRWSRFDGAMLAVALVTIVTVAFYWFAGSFYIGPRYWFLAAFPAVYLSARGLAWLSDAAPGKRGQIGAAFLVLCAVSLLVFLPWRAVTKYHEYENVHPSMRVAAANDRFGNAIVLVTDRGDPASYLVLNDPWMRDPGAPIFLKDLGGAQAEAIRAAFPGRKVVHFKTNWQRPKDR